MNRTVHYLYDPLCGWCYGAFPAISSLLETPGLTVHLLPTGLFSGIGARPMDDAFASFAWSNDQRIERLTGQRFSESYRSHVLGDRGTLFDSSAATLALTAVSLMQPTRELEALKAIQHARYVDGKDVTSRESLVRLLEDIGLDTSASRLAKGDADLFAISQGRVSEAQLLMREVGARGVPTLVAGSGDRKTLLNTSACYSNPPNVEALLSQLASS